MRKKPLLLLLICLLPLVSAKGEKAGTWPIADGTFIQESLAKTWDDKTWSKEMNYLKELGMNYIIFAPTAEGEGESQNLRTLYPTKQEGWYSKYPDLDLVDTILKEAQKAGLKVILGMNFNDLWWKIGGSNSKWLHQQMELGNKVAYELYNNYYESYKDTFVGWYFVWEIDNISFTNKKAEESLIEALNIQLDFLNELDSNLFFMFCPFMNYRLGTKEAYRDFWIRLFAEAHLRPGDIFAPMDCVGAGGLNLDNFSDWFKELRKAVDTKPGLLFWSDTEVFDQKDWTSVPIGKFVQQMEGVAPYVDNIITFAYSHYYSPNVTESGFHDTYLEYVKTGKIEKIEPEAPHSLQMFAMPDGSNYLMWQEGEDNLGIAGYIVYREGRQVGRTQVARIGAQSGMIKAYKENARLVKGRTYKYTVRAYDFAGNLSKESEVYEYTVE